MSDEAIAFRIHAAIMAQFNRYWSPAGWLTRAEWLAFQGGEEADWNFSGLEAEGEVGRGVDSPRVQSAR